MEHRLTQQGTQASKLVPEMYKELKNQQGGPGSIDSYNIDLDESNTAMLNAGVDITVAAKGIGPDYDVLNVNAFGGDAKYTMLKASSFDSSAVFSTVISLSSTLTMLIAYVSPDIVHMQTCSLPKSDNIAINLEIGDSEEIKKYNLQALTDTGSHFFTSIDYGYGVGTFQASKGGFAHVTTAYGNEVFFSISADGAVRKDSNYVKPNEPYSVILEASEIGVILDDVTASQVYSAGEIIVRGSTGPITYTRAADSTESVIYFTDTRKDGKLAVLSYTAASKTIQASII